MEDKLIDLLINYLWKKIIGFIHVKINQPRFIVKWVSLSCNWSLHFSFIWNIPIGLWNNVICYIVLQMKKIIQSGNRHCAKKSICELILLTLRATQAWASQKYKPWLRTCTMLMSAIYTCTMLMSAIYTKAWKKKNNNFKCIFRSWKQSYAELRTNFSTSVICNQGTVVDFNS